MKIDDNFKELKEALNTESNKLESFSPFKDFSIETREAEASFYKHIKGFIRFVKQE